MSETWAKDDATQWLSRIDAVVAEACLDVVPASKPSSSVLEVGVFRGGWTGSLAVNGPAGTQFMGIDPYPGADDVRNEMLARLDAFGVGSRYRHFNSWSELIEQQPQSPGTIDLIHIDGEHTQSAVELDLEMAASLLADDGIIILDDISNPWFPGIPAATFNFLASGDFALLLYTRTKAYICRRSSHAELRRSLRENLVNRKLLVHDFIWQESADALGYREPQKVFGVDVLLCVSPDNDAIYPEYPELHLAPRKSARIFKALAPPVLQNWIVNRGSRLR